MAGCPRQRPGYLCPACEPKWSSPDDTRGNRPIFDRWRPEESLDFQRWIREFYHRMARRSKRRVRHLCAANHGDGRRSEEHTSELQSQSNLVCRLLLEKKKKIKQ